MGTQDITSLKRALEHAFRDYHHELRRQADPISLVYPYSAPQDQEVVAFLVALISYGNVGTILKSGANLLSPLGPRPFDYLVSEKPLNLWAGFKHRFTQGADIEVLSHWIRHVLRAHGSLENFFVFTSPSKTAAMKDKLSEFVKGLWNQPLPTNLQKTVNHRRRNLKYLLSDPHQGSACKRLNMFLRWVVRPKDGVDLGIWGQISPKELMLPLDTHLIQTLKKLRWIKSENTNWNTVELATQKLRDISENDPIRYDFALCHLSMSGKNFRDYQKISKSLETR